MRHPLLLPVDGGQANSAILFCVYGSHVICTVAIPHLPWQSNFTFSCFLWSPCDTCCCYSLL